MADEIRSELQTARERAERLRMQLAHLKRDPAVCNTLAAQKRLMNAYDELPSESQADELQRARETECKALQATLEAHLTETRRALDEEVWHAQQA